MTATASLLDRLHGRIATPVRWSWPLPQSDVHLDVIVNPFRRAERDGVSLNDLADAHPTVAAEKLESYVQQTRQALSSSNADVILYALFGARGSQCTPMQFGGLYLEAERELLSEVAGRRPVILFVVGNDDLYIDFVSDLPADVFGWDAVASTFDVAYVRTLRPGLLMANDDAADVILSMTEIPISQFIEREF